jgi:uncharacterized protein YndB with AHSA1/START domain
MTTKIENKTVEAADDYLGREFSFTREFAASRELVFQAWTEAKHVAQWWGPRGFTAPVCQWNALVGQPIYVVMRGPDGAEHPMGGEFLEVAPPERLVMACGALNEKGERLFEFVHAVTFAEQGGKTLVTVNSRVTKTTGAAKNYIGGFKMGMSMTLDRLGKFVEQGLETDLSDREIVISREFDAPREMVWDAMTDPAKVVKWWGPRGFTTTIETMNVRPGGIWKHVMRGADGTEYPNESIFTEVVKPERIVYTHGGRKKGGPEVQFVATWTFDVVTENRTRLTLRQVYPSAEMRETVVRVYGAIEGGKQCLARLAEELERAEGQGK